METFSNIEKKIASDNERYYNVKITDVVRMLVYYGRVEKVTFSVLGNRVDIHGMNMFVNTADGYANRCRDVIALCPGTRQYVTVNDYGMGMELFTVEDTVRFLKTVGVKAED